MCSYNYLLFECTVPEYINSYIYKYVHIITHTCYMNTVTHGNVLIIVSCSVNPACYID